jgi:hypothetical protein
MNNFLSLTKAERVCSFYTLQYRYRKPNLTRTQRRVRKKGINDVELPARKRFAAGVDGRGHGAHSQRVLGSLVTRGNPFSNPCIDLVADEGDAVISDRDWCGKGFGANARIDRASREACAVTNLSDAQQSGIAEIVRKPGHRIT